MPRVARNMLSMKMPTVSTDHIWRIPTPESTISQEMSRVDFFECLTAMAGVQSVSTSRNASLKN
jgi:hypothetical protein